MTVFVIVGTRKDEHSLRSQVGIGSVICGVICNLSLMACFADINASQGSVAIYARCGGIFDITLTANLPGNLPVRKFLKSVKNRQNYGEEYVASFFGPPCKCEGTTASYCGIDSLSHILIGLHRRIEVKLIAFDSGQSAFSYRLPAIIDSRLSLCK